MPFPELHADVPAAEYDACTPELQSELERLEEEWEVQSTGVPRGTPPSAAAIALEQARVVALGRLQHGINADPAQFPVPPQSRRSVEASVTLVRAWLAAVVTEPVGAPPRRRASSAATSTGGGAAGYQPDSGMDTSIVSRPFTLSFASEGSAVVPLANFAATSAVVPDESATRQRQPQQPPNRPPPLTAAVLGQHTKGLSVLSFAGNAAT